MKNMWDQRYDKEAYAYGKQPNDFLVEKSGLIPPGPVLCLADGEGRNGVYLARQGYQVTSLDSSIKGLEKANALAAEYQTSIQTLHQDLADFQCIPDQWSGIISIFCHLPAPLRNQVHAEVVKGLRPGGMFILEAYTPDQLQFKTGGPPTLELLCSLEDLKKDFQELELLHAEENIREVTEGQLHTGRAAVVQIVARKPA